MTMLQQQLQKVFPSLPQEIKDLLLADDFNDNVSKIALSHGCNEIQTGMLIRLTVRLLSGLIAATQFVTLISEELDISHDESAFIAQEINRDIFNPIKDALKQVHAIDKSGAERQVASPTERPLGTAPIVPSAPIVPNLSALPAHANDPIAVAPKAATPAAAPVMPPVTASKPLPSFSVAQALGNIPSSGNTQATVAPTDDMPKAHVGTIAASAAKTERSGNILEDKLGGTYRMKTETTSSVGVPTQPLSPTQVIPPPAQATTRAPEVGEKSPLAKALDPYRESAI